MAVEGWKRRTNREKVSWNWTVTEDWFPDSPIVIRINPYSSLRSFRFTGHSPRWRMIRKEGHNIEYWECFVYLQRTKTKLRLIWMRNKIVSIHRSYSMDGNGMWNCESPALLGDRKNWEILSNQFNCIWLDWNKIDVQENIGILFVVMAVSSYESSWLGAIKYSEPCQ